MITQDYIRSFKKTHAFKIISDGFLKGDFEKVLLGREGYRITNQYELEDTIPSQVLISMHILILEGRLSSEPLNTAFFNLPINKHTVCLLLSYLDSYLVYLQGHNDLVLDYLELLSQLRKAKNEYCHLKCFNNMMTSIEGKLFGKN